MNLRIAADQTVGVNRDCVVGHRFEMWRSSLGLKPEVLYGGCKLRQPA